MEAYNILQSLLRGPELWAKIKEIQKKAQEWEKVLSAFSHLQVKIKWRICWGEFMARVGIKVYHFLLTRDKKIPADDEDKIQEK